MRLPFFIAFRYLFSKKKISAINIINAIAMIGFGVGAFAMVVILSAFNGFEVLVEGLINNYDPDIKITSKHKKVFVQDGELIDWVKEQENVKAVSSVLEEKVVIKFNDRQEIAKIKGVDQSYYSSGFDSLIVMGDFNLGDSFEKSSVFWSRFIFKTWNIPGKPFSRNRICSKKGSGIQQPKSHCIFKYSSNSSQWIIYSSRRDR